MKLRSRGSRAVISPDPRLSRGLRPRRGRYLVDLSSCEKNRRNFGNTSESSERDRDSED